MLLNSYTYIHTYSCWPLLLFRGTRFFANLRKWWKLSTQTITVQWPLPLMTGDHLRWCLAEKEHLIVSYKPASRRFFGLGVIGFRILSLKWCPTQVAQTGSPKLAMQDLRNRKDCGFGDRRHRLITGLRIQGLIISSLGLGFNLEAHTLSLF